jgi:hypothetical protein
MIVLILVTSLPDNEVAPKYTMSKFRILRKKNFTSASIVWDGPPRQETDFQQTE